MLLTWPRLTSWGGGGCCSSSHHACLALRAHQGGEAVAPPFVPPTPGLQSRVQPPGLAPTPPRRMLRASGDGERDVGLVPLRGVVGAVN